MPIKPQHPLTSARKPPRDTRPTSQAPVASAAAGEPPKRPLDGEGKPYITLAQLLKASDLAGTGGAAKHRVREGGITVNGDEEQRPGRKLHAGDIVVADGKTLTVVI